MMKKLLLADDSITIQKVVGIILSTEDYQLEITDDGDRAFAKALAEIPDLVIADISMPGKDGFELCRAIKSEACLSNTSVLLLPGAFDHFDEMKAAEVCADGWLTKPFESQALLDKVAQLLEVEPLKLTGIDTPAVSGVTANDDDSFVTEAVLGFDDEEILTPPLHAEDEESPDDIWNAVSFAEEDIPEQNSEISADSVDDVSFAADVIDPSAVDEVAITPAAGEEAVFPFAAADAGGFVTEEPTPEVAAELQPESFVGVDLLEESVPDVSNSVEFAPEFVAQGITEEAEPVDFSVYGETDDDLPKPVAVSDDDTTPFSFVDDSDEPLELVAAAEEDSAVIVEESPPAVIETDGEEPLELMADDVAEQGVVADIDAGEPVFSVATADDDETIMELQEEDIQGEIEQDDIEPVIQRAIAAEESVEAVTAAVVDDEILDLSADEIIADEPPIESSVAEDNGSFVSGDTEPK
ncbi:MAG: response regulator, partial [Thermodesulfobacteriota bacterium]|nr:response regulator [Thermodesulfobacteriota bacterium]